ncbi:MAG: hypothetical protein WCA81_13470 [Rhizomicrobium sp.]
MYTPVPVSANRITRQSFFYALTVAQAHPEGKLAPAACFYVLLQPERQAGPASYGELSQDFAGRFDRLLPQR